MSSNALVTIIAPLWTLDRVADAEAAIDILGNPARHDIRAALDRHEDAEHGTHFASLHAFKSQDDKRAYLVFEFSADGPEADALARIDRQIGEHLSDCVHARERLDWWRICSPIFAAIASPWAMAGFQVLDCSLPARPD